MNYLVNAVKFSIKNWMLILPLFILTALASLIGGVGSAANLTAITGLLAGNTDPSSLFAAIPALLTSIIGGGTVAFIIPFIYMPATYGLVNKSLETGNATLNDIGASISNNFVKYIIYFVGLIVVYLVCGIPTLLLLLLFSWLTTVIGGLGILLLGIIILALVVVFIVLSVLLSLWFSAMVIDGLDVVAAAKKSIEVVKGFFWTILGITVIVAIAASIISAIIGFLGAIPLLGPILISVVPTAQTFLMIVFSIMVYRERTGRINAA
ncbi:MAG: hypothetical protein GXY17_05175 [Clostridiaceae bacterium]|nr:hypothetical protein [Clostridiaceae bacterium]